MTRACSGKNAFREHFPRKQSAGGCFPFSVSLSLYLVTRGSELLVGWAWRASRHCLRTLRGETAKERAPWLEDAVAQARWVGGCSVCCLFDPFPAPVTCQH